MAQFTISQMLIYSQTKLPRNNSEIFCKYYCRIKKHLLHLRSENNADVVKLVDTLDLGSSAARRGGSSPFIRTTQINRFSLTVNAVFL